MNSGMQPSAAIFRVFRVFRGLPAKQPQQQRQNRAQQQTGDDGKMETEIALGIMDVTGQAPQPASAETRPQQRAHRCQQQPGNYQKFAQLIHNPKMAREALEGNEGFGKSQQDFILQHDVGDEIGLRRVAMKLKSKPQRGFIHTPSKLFNPFRVDEWVGTHTQRSH